MVCHNAIDAHLHLNHAKGRVCEARICRDNLALKLYNAGVACSHATSQTVNALLQIPLPVPNK